MNNRKKHIEVDRIVSMIDETRTAEHFRNPDRPDAQFVKSRHRQDSAVRRAKCRIRTAVYRNKLDQRRAPSTQQIGMSMVLALVTSSQSSITPNDRDIIGRALADLQFRGFDIVEVRDTLRRLRRRVVDQDHVDDAVADSDNPVVNI